MLAFQDQEKTSISFRVSLTLDGLVNLVDHIEADGDPHDQLSYLQKQLIAYSDIYHAIDDPSMRCIVEVIK